MEIFEYEFYSFLRISQEETEFLLYIFHSSPHIHIKNYREGLILRENFNALTKEQLQECIHIITSLFINKQQVTLEGSEIHEMHFILQLQIANKKQTLIIPLEVVEKVGEDFKQVENMYMIYRQNYFLKEKEEMLEQIASLRQMLEEKQIVKADQSKLQTQSIKRTNLQQIDRYQRRYKRLNVTCQQLRSKCRQLQKLLKQSEEKLQYIDKMNKTVELKQRQIPSTPTNFDSKMNNITSIAASKSKYLVHNYQDCTRITRVKDTDFDNAKAEETQPYYKGAYNNQFTDYFQAKKQQKKQAITSDGFNQFVFEPFTIGKYINYFQIKDRNIRFRQKVDIYYHITSFHGIPLTGRTKIGFQVVEMSASNIIVGVMLTVRKRLRYSFQQANIISYKMKGGKYGLYIDGSPTHCRCEEVKKGECIWMIVDRQRNTITFQKEGTLIRQMPERFQHAALFPFITMKDQGDEVKIL